MAKKDFLNFIALTPEQASKQKLKEFRNKELNAATGKVFALNSTQRAIDVNDAQRAGFADNEVLALMTKTAVKKFEEASKKL
jgi:hypothetical protein